MKQCVNYDIFRYTIKMQTYYENFLKSTTHVVLTTSIIYIESRINFQPVVYRKILADMNICKIFRKSQFSYDTLGSRALTVLNYNSMEMKIIYHNFGCIVNKMSLIVKKIYGTKKVTNLKMPIFLKNCDNVIFRTPYRIEVQFGIQISTASAVLWRDLSCQ